MGDPSLPVAVDAVGGDRAPEEIVQGARRAADAGVPVVLVGPPGLVGDPKGLELVPCTEVIAMDEDPGPAVRKKKDSSLVRAAELVRDGAASAMVSAGNTGATMASALLRTGRIKGVVRPAIATPLPRLEGPPAVLLDSGANAECTPAMLVQFARMGAAYAEARFGVTGHSVALLSIGEEPSKGSALVKETHQLLSDAHDLSFRGNIEGRELLDCPVDVVVTDGFTGNVALKSVEGALRFVMRTLLDVLATDDETRRAADILMPHLLPVAERLDPETVGGAMLLGTRGVCVISHGSSSAVAIDNAVRVAHDLAARDLVADLAAALAS
jgi:phosphate acyltransferase